jgi:hypothetical protein
LKKAEEAHQKLTVRIEERTRDALSAKEQFDAEKKRLNAWGRKLGLEQQRAVEEKEQALKENRELRQNNQGLLERLDAVNAASKVPALTSPHERSYYVCIKLSHIGVK